MKNFMKKTEGFTLVELIVVIAILGILAAVAVPAYTGYIDKAKEASDTQVVSAMNTAFAAACTEVGYATTDVTTADCVLEADGTVGTITVTAITGVEADDMTAECAKVVAAFDRYFVGNGDTVLKYYKSFTYADGNFAGSPDAEA